MFIGCRTEVANQRGIVVKCCYIGEENFRWTGHTVFTFLILFFND